MNRKEEIFQYLAQYRGKGDADNVILRAGNALFRYKVTAIEEAAGLSDRDIARMRNVGEKTKAFIRQASALSFGKPAFGCPGIFLVRIKDYQKEQAQASGRGS